MTTTLPTPPIPTARADVHGPTVYDESTPTTTLPTPPIPTARPDVRRRRRRDQSGQTTAEYALLTGVMALVLALVAAWATGTGKIGQLLDTVFNQLIRAAGG